ncbi:UDP-N-acetylmuramoyl-tripeptide--D-alanyl-D-alanine ligase [Paenarthrobacter sp. PH39-S1]|uniref:UDP-N-acetylmuramoyl-tripeptide--D-alanyl-D- alanine ligase n=1 Tax=Paenarthrobacter sp. PH39-S1 TaxID=3046204 RepID=UPI0024B9516B|nr:UDP-N-acetylmuramoyl-tripeptide--D-alanyl-D-alanine ligase [Paenarthrobacter sp. PH39-S1]MDJ0356946.1 UDP-N-acetylmuramoyl-tripeptide--D-alanyl-D-alanine ligase [Paenarthrobacter sp. PH39-S1]
MIELTAAQLAALTHGRLTSTADPKQMIGLGHIVTDSRAAFPGSLYVAKPGESADGHGFISAAVAAGAVLMLAEREILDPAGRSYPAVIVPDAVLALGALAAEAVRLIRAAGTLTVVGITGSAGKTTTKDLLAGILSRLGPTVAPQGSYNGEIGVPLTVFMADESTRYLIIEMGATGIGHIRYLASLVKPDIGVVLGVGTAHAGEFGSVENTAKAKGELVEALSSDGTAVLNRDDVRVSAMAGRTPARIVFFGVGSPDTAGGHPMVRASEATTNAQGHPEFILHFTDGAAGGGGTNDGAVGESAADCGAADEGGAAADTAGRPVTSGLLGLHQVTNLLAAAAAARVAGASADLIAEALNGQKAQSRWRMERTVRPDGVTVINDAYNANPESMRAALRTLAELGRGDGGAEHRTWAVLGAMLELGADSIHEHDAIGRVAVRLNISRLVVVGQAARAMHVAAVMEGSWGDESVFVEDADAAYALLRRELSPGDIVLFKSSNGAGLRFLGDRIALPTDGTEGEGTRNQ